MSELVLEKTHDLPFGWINVILDDIVKDEKFAIVDGPFGTQLHASEYTETGVPLVRIQNILWNMKFNSEKLAFISEEKFQQLQRSAVYPNDILLAKTGGTIGKVSLFPKLFKKGLIASSCAKISINEKLSDVLFILYFLYSSSGQSQIMALSTGSTRKSLNNGQIRKIFLRLPPLNEQKRIVEKIEELFLDVSHILNLFKEIKLELKIYEKSVYNHAMMGSLSNKWRSNNVYNSKHSENLLDDILEQRRKKWEELELKKFSENKKTPKSDSWKKKYRVPLEPSDDLPSIPDSWKWITLDQITWSVKDGPHFSPQYSDSGIPFITGGNVRPNGVDFENCKKISPDLHKQFIKRCNPEKNDILYTKGGTTGIARVNSFDVKFSVWVHVAVLKLVDYVRPFFVQHALNSPFCYAQSQKYTHGVGNQDLGLTRMIKIHLTLPPLKEQDYLIQMLENIHDEILRLESIIENQIILCTNIKSIILKQAFEGKLVPQDPNDEPAGILLEKIKQEKEQLKEKIKKKKRNGS